MVVRRSVRAAALIVAMLVPFRAAHAHPIHMSYTEIRYLAGGRSIEIAIRVYANDFSAAAARRAGVSLKADSTIDQRNALAYISQTFQITDGIGKMLTATPCGIARAQEMLKFCFVIPTPSAVSGIRVRNTVMTELFKDQVNVVQVAGMGGRKSRLFVRGDGWKAL